MIYVLSREIGFGMVGRAILLAVGIIYDLIFGMLLMSPMALLMSLEYVEQRWWARYVALAGILVWLFRWIISGLGSIGWFFVVFAIVGMVGLGVAVE
jgi:hypothetical protein